MNFSTLKSRVTTLLDRADTNIDTLVGYWVNDARRHIAAQYNFECLLTTTSLTTTGSTATVALPSDFLDLSTVHITATEVFPMKPQHLGDYLDASETQPKFYMIEGSSLRLFPTPDTAYTLTTKYYALPSDFSSSSDNDYISNTYPMAIIYYASMLGCIWAEDPRIGMFSQLYTTERAFMIQRERQKKKNRMDIEEDYVWPLDISNVPVGGGNE